MKDPVHPAVRLDVTGLVLGCAAALAIGFAIVHGFYRAGQAVGGAGQIMTALALLDRNLGWSIPAFALLTAAFCAALASLRARVAARADAERIAQADHLLELSINLVFGVGVIFTAVGMRGALLFALGDPEQIRALGAFGVLQRMVDGGILLALSTTIAGGVMGYGMRVVKAMVVGAALKRAYARATRRQGVAIERTLMRIECALAARCHHPREAREVAVPVQSPPPAREDGADVTLG